MKAGPCAGCAGASEFLRLQNKLCSCLSGSRLAKDRAAETVSKVMIPEALDYPSMSMNKNIDEETASEIERQSMEADIACVGFGPAMGGFLTTLTRAWNENPLILRSKARSRRVCHCR